MENWILARDLHVLDFFIRRWEFIGIILVIFLLFYVSFGWFNCLTSVLLKAGFDILLFTYD